MHRHRPQSRWPKQPTWRCFQACIPQAHRACDPRAHGNVERTDYCSCGQERHTNINQSFTEMGVWHTHRT